MCGFHQVLHWSGALRFHGSGYRWPSCRSLMYGRLISVSPSVCLLTLSARERFVVQQEVLWQKLLTEFDFVSKSSNPSTGRQNPGTSKNDSSLSIGHHLWETIKFDCEDSWIRAYLPKRSRKKTTSHQDSESARFWIFGPREFMIHLTMNRSCRMRLWLEWEKMT